MSRDAPAPLRPRRSWPAAEPMGHRPVDFGSWHGDWAPWNMGYRDDIVQLWDWERFSSPVPIGFDAIHFAAQHVRHDRTGHRAARGRLLKLSSSPLLTGDGLAAGAPRAPAGAGAVSADAQRPLRAHGSRVASPALHPRARWALDFAERVIAGGDEFRRPGVVSHASPPTPRSPSVAWRLPDARRPRQCHQPRCGR